MHISNKRNPCKTKEKNIANSFVETGSPKSWPYAAGKVMST